jgi:hypothetical protein
MSQIHYLPLTPGFFAILVGIFVIVLILRSVANTGAPAVSMSARRSDT